jgi:hypothetical protein
LRRLANVAHGHKELNALLTKPNIHRLKSLVNMEAAEHFWTKSAVGVKFSRKRVKLTQIIRNARSETAFCSVFGRNSRWHGGC